MSQPLLNGPTDETVRLKREIAGLEQELQEAKDEAATAKVASSDAVQAIRALRRELEPLFKSLKMIFGELSRVDAETLGSPSSARETSNNSIWQERIAKAPPSEGRILRTLLDGGGPMTLQQIRIAAGTSSNTSTYLGRLSAKNWIHKAGHGSYALKEL